MKSVDKQLKNRYPGGKPFSEQDNHLFFGRETDLKNLSDLLFIKQSIVLFGKSGFGKSSLINAGLVPFLRQQGTWTYFSIRFNNYFTNAGVSQTSPLATVIEKLSEKVSGKRNSEFEKIIPDENSLWYWVKHHQRIDEKLKFIVFFDQFEELFSYPKEQVQVFARQLSELLNGDVPVNFKIKIEELDQKGRISEATQNFAYDEPEVKVVFSIRSDRLSQMTLLNDWLPFILQDCYELDALSEIQAVKAITEPAKLGDKFFKTVPFDYEENAIAAILKDIVRDGKIETPTLQIVCRYIEENLVENIKGQYISAEQLGDITNIFQHYYENVLNNFKGQERNDVQFFLEEQLIDADRRNTFTGEYIERHFPITRSTLDILEKSSLLTKERASRNLYMYEIGHDRIVTAINRVATKRREEEKYKLFLDERQKREEKELETYKVLQEKEQRQKEMELLLIVKEEQKKKTEALLELQKTITIKGRRNSRILIGIISTIAIMLIAGFWFSTSMRKMEYERIIALKQKDTVVVKINNINTATALKYAEERMEIGDDYNRKHAKAEALRCYKQALDTLKNYSRSPLYGLVKKKVKALLKSNSSVLKAK